MANRLPGTLGWIQSPGPLGKSQKFVAELAQLAGPSTNLRGVSVEHPDDVSTQVLSAFPEGDDLSKSNHVPTQEHLGHNRAMELG